MSDGAEENQQSNSGPPAKPARLRSWSGPAVLLKRCGPPQQQHETPHECRPPHKARIIRNLMKPSIAHTLGALNWPRIAPISANDIVLDHTAATIAVLTLPFSVHFVGVTGYGFSVEDLRRGKQSTTRLATERSTCTVGRSGRRGRGCNNLPGSMSLNPLGGHTGLLRGAAKDVPLEDRGSLGSDSLLWQGTLGH